MSTFGARPRRSASPPVCPAADSSPPLRTRASKWWTDPRAALIARDDQREAPRCPWARRDVRPHSSWWSRVAQRLEHSWHPLNDSLTVPAPSTACASGSPHMCQRRESAARAGLMTLDRGGWAFWPLPDPQASHRLRPSRDGPPAATARGARFRGDCPSSRHDIAALGLAGR